MEYILKNGIVYDPTNNVNGDKKDVMIKDGKIVDNVSSDAKVLDVTDKLVMAAGVDVHSHIAGPKLCLGRLYRPEDSRAGVVAKTDITRAETGFSIPSCSATGYRYSRIGYGTVTEAAVPPLEAKHTHEEIMAIPNIDVSPLALFGNNWFVLQFVKENDLEGLAAFVSSWLKISRCYGMKVVNPCGSEAWGWGQNVHGINDPAPYWGVTGGEVVRALTKVNEMLGLPHSMHVHPNDLGHPGNYPTTIDTLDVVKDIKKNPNVLRDQTIHCTHLQFHSYGGTSWRDAKSGAEPVADYINKNKHVTCDVGQVTFDETTTMTADAPMEYDLYKLTGLKWANKDIELETASGLIPVIYSPKSPVSTLQWAIGLELFLLIKDPWQVVLTTDSPNAGPFIRYPRIISWLMSSDRRTEMIENKEVHNWASKRTSLPTLDRVYDWNDIAITTRSAPAKILGLEKRGHLGIGANADVAVYDIEPENFDATKASNAAVVEDVLTRAAYTIKDGEVVVKDGKIVKIVPSRHMWTNVTGFEQQEKKVLEDIMPMFNRYYTVKFENYKVFDHYIDPAIEFTIDASK
ncbi:formylmethanofuran dehydrogenase subunit A [Methanobacterium sp.]|uniref:formylmethanofuran dehydrogenase subunit A n=1 Tax=Methanobacterium sp. TaxID=2164 RepID=UPI003C76B7FE